MDINIDKLIEDDIKDRINKKQREKALRNYYENPNYCQHCNQIIIVKKNDSVSDTKKKKFCNVQCSVRYFSNEAKNKNNRICKKCGNKISRNSRSGLCPSCYIEEKAENKIRLWKETGETGCNATSMLRNCIRDYIFEKQNKQCAICGMNNTWNGNELHFILDHINGDASNNWENNLRLICPNCDSQLDTYKSKNKNSARNHRKKYT